MADIRLSLNGEDNASSAMRSAADGVSALEDAASTVAPVFLAATAAVTAFAKASLDAYQAQEKADRQLRAVAGGLTSAFQEQASAMQEVLGVSDDMVERMQTMLLRFGEAPADVEATVRALLDYSAATGTDALAATERLTSSVNAGKIAFKETGIAYDTTGSKSKDLVIATQALAAKFAGTAAGEAASLEGSARKAKEALGELQEGFGALINEIASKSGIVETVALALRGFRESLFGTGTEEKDQQKLLALERTLATVKELAEAKQQLALVEIQLANNPNDRNAQADKAWFETVIANDTKILGATRAAGIGGDPGGVKLPTKPIGGGDDRTAKAMSASGKQKGSELLPVDARWREGNQRHFQEQQAQFQEDMRLAEAEDNLAADKQRKLEAHARQIADHAAQEADRAAKANEAAARRTAEAWKQAGETVAVSLIQNVGGALQALAEGNQVSAKGLLSGILGTLGSLIPGFGAIGSAIGQQVGGLVGGAIDQGNRSGGNVTINTIDGTSSREWFERSGARQLNNARRVGRAPAWG